MRLGASICSPFSCTCGAAVDSRGAHGLSCLKSAGRQPRHAQVNDLIFKAFSRAGIPSVKEPTGLLPLSNLRPDGVTIIPWSQGKCLAWDFTCPDTVAPSSLQGSAYTAGSAAERAARLKTQKYLQLSSSHTFIPVAIETFGSINAEGMNLISRLGGKIIAATGDKRERMFLFQQLSLAIQRGNIASFTGALRQDIYFQDS